MFLRYRADGDGADTLYEFRPEKTPWNRATIAEKLYSKAVGERRTWEQLVADALQGGIAARRVALWIAMCADHPLLRFEDIADVEVGQLSMEYSRAELRRGRDQIAAADHLLEADKAAQLAMLDREIASAPVGKDEPQPDPDPAVAEPVDGTGKAHGSSDAASSSCETSTG